MSTFGVLTLDDDSLSIKGDKLFVRCVKGSTFDFNDPYFGIQFRFNAIYGDQFIEEYFSKVADKFSLFYYDEKIRTKIADRIEYLLSIFVEDKTFLLLIYLNFIKLKSYRNKNLHLLVSILDKFKYKTFTKIFILIAYKYYWTNKLRNVLKRDIYKSVNSKLNNFALIFNMFPNTERTYYHLLKEARPLNYMVNNIFKDNFLRVLSKGYSHPFYHYDFAGKAILYSMALFYKDHLDKLPKLCREDTLKISEGRIFSTKGINFTSLVVNIYRRDYFHDCEKFYSKHKTRHPYLVIPKLFRYYLLPESVEKHPSRYIKGCMKLHNMYKDNSLSEEELYEKVLKFVKNCKIKVHPYEDREIVTKEDEPPDILGDYKKIDPQEFFRLLKTMKPSEIVKYQKDLY